MTEIVKYDKPAGEVKPGNYIFGRKVVEVRPKRVNTTIVFDDAVADHFEYPFKLTDMLEVGVEEKTEAEKQAQRDEHDELDRQDFVKRMRKLHQSSVKLVEAADGKRVERIAKGWGRSDYFTYDALLTADVMFDRTMQIQYAFDQFDAGDVRNHDGHECEYTVRTETGHRCVIESPAYTEYEYAVLQYRRLTTELYERALRRSVLSRSTSTMSNLVDDLKDAAVASIIDSFRYDLPAELRKQFS